MTMDRTLRTHGGLVRARSVLTRTERIQRLVEDGKFDLERIEKPEEHIGKKYNPLGLPKVKIRHSKAGTKSKKAAEEVAVEGVEAAEGAEAGQAPAAEKE